MQRQREAQTRSQMMGSRALAARVLRYHTWPVIHRQTVAEHSARVATLYVEVFGLPRAEVLYYILHHDSGEFFAGDPPYPVKQLVPGYKMAHGAAEVLGYQCMDVVMPDLAVWEEHRVKVADLLEMHEFGMLELNMGNTYADPIARDTWDAALQYSRDKLQPDDANAVARWMKKHGRENA
jgi:hypothetical protein